MQAVTFFFAFVVVLALIGIAAWLVRRFAGNRLGANTNRGRMPRLAVIDAAAVDGRRRLVLVRRDNVEHLIMIGGPTDIVVEPNIVRATAGRDQLPQRPAGAEPPPRIAPLPDAAAWADEGLRADIFDHPAPAQMPEPPPRPARPSFAEEARRMPPALSERRDPLAGFALEPLPRPEPRHEPRPEIRPEPRPEPRSEPRAELRPEPNAAGTDAIAAGAVAAGAAAVAPGAVAIRRSRCHCGRSRCRCARNRCPAGTDAIAAGTNATADVAARRTDDAAPCAAKRSTEGPAAVRAPERAVVPPPPPPLLLRRPLLSRARIKISPRWRSGLRPRFAGRRPRRSRRNRRPAAPRCASSRPPQLRLSPRPRRKAVLRIWKTRWRHCWAVRSRSLREARTTPA